MPKVEQIASYLLSISIPGTSWSITPLKLQKLLYYCQGWYMAYKGVPLFDEEIEAWEHGPVVREIYLKYREYRYLTIPKEIFENNDELGRPILDDKQIEILNTVWENYGQFDGKYLEELTHQEEPWLDTNLNNIISKSKISEFFSNLIE